MLPVLLSIPHGGTDVPEELEGRLHITPRAQFDDSDPFTREIYDLADSVACVVKASVARAYVDLNRPRTRMAPDDPDGLVKSATCYNEQIYIKGMEPDAQLVETLIGRYHTPYYERIAEACKSIDGLKLCLDCHSMAEHAPPVSPDAKRGNTTEGKQRPVICLSNRDGRTCPMEWLERLAGCISASFGIDRDVISLNSPFKGGYITESFGCNPLPWIQIEMNRSLYLHEEWFDSDTMRMSLTRLAELNRMFRDALEGFFDGGAHDI